jgi:N-acetylglucosamine transport system permease protein
MKKRLNIHGISGSILLVLYGISIIVPVLWVVISSFKSTLQIQASPWSLPTSFRWDNFSTAWTSGGIGRGVMNSFIATSCTLVILIPMGAMAAYVLAKYPFKGSRWIQTIFMSGLMFPNFLVIVPLYLLMSRMGLVNTLPGLVIAYIAYSLAFTIFVLIGFFDSLPTELVEAAMIDGCGHFRAYQRVMLPLAKPGILVVTVFNAIGLWNEYPLALVLAQKSTVQTIPVGIAALTTNQQYSADYGALFAGVTMVMVPTILVYWVFKEQIRQVMLAGAIKG